MRQWTWMYPRSIWMTERARYGIGSSPYPGGFVRWAFDRDACVVAPRWLAWLYRLLPYSVVWNPDARGEGDYSTGITAPTWGVAWVVPGYLVIHVGQHAVRFFTPSAWNGGQWPMRRRFGRYRPVMFSR